MLKLNFCLETPNDAATPIAVAMALIDSPLFNEYELKEIANHLLVYTARINMTRSKYEENQNKSQ